MGDDSKVVAELAGASELFGGVKELGFVFDEVPVELLEGSDLGQEVLSGLSEGDMEARDEPPSCHVKSADVIVFGADVALAEVSSPVAVELEVGRI